jgi:hypothetical protein
MTGPAVPSNRPVTRVICDALASLPDGGTVLDLLVPYLLHRGITEAPERLEFARLHQAKRSLKANLRAAVREGYVRSNGRQGNNLSVYTLETVPRPPKPVPPKPAPPAAKAEAMAEAHAKVEATEYKWVYCPPGKAAPPRFVPSSCGWKPPAMACTRADVLDQEAEPPPSRRGDALVPHRAPIAMCSTQK